jgi:hypothetical protein
MVMVDELARAMLEVPPMFRADGTPLPAFKLAAPAMMPAGQDLAGVFGGHTMAGHPVAEQSARSSRWTIAILAIAALTGIGAAVAFQLEPSAVELAATEPEGRPEERMAVMPPAPPPANAAAAAAGDVEPTSPTEPPTEEVPPTQEPPPAETDAKEPTDAKASTDAREPTPPVAPPVAPPSRDPRKPAQTPRRAALRASAPASAPARAPKKEPGILRVHTTPWAWAIVGNERQDTPAAKFKLPPGHHTVRLNFPTLGITETHHVTIESTKTFTLNINKEDE